MPVPSSAITRFELGATFEEFDAAMDRKGFIGPRVLVPRLVAIQAANFGKVPLKELLKQADGTKRAPGAAYKRGATLEFDKFAYSTEDHGAEEVLDDRQIRIYQQIIDAEKITSDRAIDKVLRQYEIDTAALVMNASTFTGALTHALTNEWDDASNATPITDINTYRESVLNNCGMEPNALIVNRFQYRNLLACNQIIERIKYTKTATPAEVSSLLADVLDLKFVLVAGGVQNTANAGQDAAISRIWSNEYAMLARVAETADPQEPCLGRTLIWSGDGITAPGDEQELAVVVEQYRDEARRGVVYRARNDRDIVLMYPQAGFLISNVTT